MREVTIYSKDNCIWCERAKSLLSSKNLPFKVVHMPRDISRDDLLAKFPDAKTMPIVTINGRWIGGYIELEKRVL